MTATPSRLAILFADISGSTALYERLGDVEARKQVADCLSTVTAQAKKYGGEVIKTIGDEVMCSFPDAKSAVTAAMGMQQVLATDDQQLTGGQTTLSIRVGLHFGPVIREAKDIFGDTVNLAARMAALSKQGQIITTQSTIEELPPQLQTTARMIDYTPVKGKRSEITIFEIIWQPEGVTNLATSVLASPLTPARLLVRYREKELQLDHDNPSLTLGRSQPCDLIVNDERASRQHARIEYRRGKYFIIDQSTNGTYVRLEDDDETFLRREEMPLRGQGMISLGFSFEKEPEEIVHFVCES